ncbi:ROK family transcriptional regulator [Kribbella sandramycini]|uniref:Putative NBD/HSP70 family sugar kinase n=1 Tax=Kribbella sandramycini TaxID=60450 RepID=A0A7Y4NYS2_9ACTN|nr:ROK family transcriptional regulator [Kribbella sandramycini]MBB6569325.1 putative NBD/HSP70 family sugar kinase [Kribbella sandramycini]NOL40836.1 ROK family transcriptional regulator [Kribbella sandramycini]
MVTADDGFEEPGRAGANQYDLGSFNEAVIIETIRLAGIISRTEISRRTGLTQQSVSRILRILLQQGLLVEEAQERAERLGKPRTPVRLRSNAAHAVGIHLDPELLTVAVVDLDGTIVRRETVDLADDLPTDKLIDLTAATVTAALSISQVDLKSMLGVGVAVPGPIDADGSLQALPLQPAWRGLKIRHLLQGKLNHPVLVEKDGTAAAIGERWIGRSARARDFAYLYLGTGVGSGLILNGSIYRGGTANAGEFGQVAALRMGEWDAESGPRMLPECNPTASLPVIAAEYGYVETDATATDEAKRYKAVCRAVAAGNEPARQAATRIAQVIGQGAVGLVDLLDIELVVLGGPAFAPEVSDILMTEIGRAVNAHPVARAIRPVAVEESMLRADAAAVGAASTIFHDAFTPRVSGSSQARRLPK